MPNLTICVLAPVVKELEQLEATDFEPYLEEVENIYEQAPDDWRPFNDGVSIREHISAVEPDYDSLSSLDRAEPEEVAALLTDVHLYVFDPLFLALEEPAGVVQQIQGAIAGDQDGRKSFALVVPDWWSGGLKAVAEATSGKKLEQLERVYESEGGDRVVWPAETPKRLRAFVKRILKRGPEGPAHANLHELLKLVADLGSKVPQIANPRLLGSNP